jgi:pyruvate kinase
MAVRGRSAASFAHACGCVTAGTGSLASETGSRRSHPVCRCARRVPCASHVAAEAEGCWAESHKTCYVEAGTRLHLRRGDKSTDDGPTLEAAVGALPASEVAIALATGDELVVTRATVAGKNAVRDARGHVLTPATIGCTADQIFEDVSLAITFGSTTER